MGIRILTQRSIPCQLLLIGLLTYCSTSLAEQNVRLPEQCSAQANWQILFDGRDLDAWELHQHGWSKWLRKLQFWRAEQPLGGWHIDTEGNLARSHTAGDLRSRAQYANFALSLEWKISAGGNSGIKLRVQDENGAAANNGFEMQVLDNAEHKDGQRGITSAGALYGLYPPSSPNAARSAGLWNQVLIVLQGQQVRFYLNGETTVEAKIDSADWQQRLSSAPQRDRISEQFARLPSGHIILQDHFDPVWFRNIRICELAD